MRPMIAIPPTTPPTIAPTGVDDFSMAMLGVKVEVVELDRDEDDFEIDEELGFVLVVDGLVFNNVFDKPVGLSLSILLLKTLVMNSRPSFSPLYVVYASRVVEKLVGPQK